MKSKFVESLANKILCCIARTSKINIEHLPNIEKAISALLEGQSLNEIEELLDHFGVSTCDLEVHENSHYVTKLSVKLGSPIPDYLHHRLHADVCNVFRPQEFVGYELEDNHYIFACVCYRIPDTDEGELDKYFITLSEDDEEGKEVTIIELCKILRMKDIQLSSGCKEIILYLPEAEGVHMWDVFKDDTLKSMLKKVYKELRKIWKVKDKNLRRKAIKALYLKWHPDKNSNQFATAVFQYLQCQIERIEQGLNLEDPEHGKSEFDHNGLNSDFWKDVGRQWEEVVRSRGEHWRRERNRRQDPSMSPTLDDDFEEQLNSQYATPDSDKALVWLKQAVHDLTALQLLVREVNAKKEVCAHVCFMAHQVAEKALKAGMYKLIGLHSNVLRWHQLVGHASAIEQVKPRETSGLRQLVIGLESYYLDSRYPNRYTPVKVPSDQYTPEDAQLAEKTARSVINIVNKVFK